jgi:DhnA family fructose-bisphosphate aldolase class Ia
MRSITALLAVAGAATVLATGCASTRTTAATYEIDHERVAQIERAARAFGTQVIWVNYPTKRVEAGK